MNETAQQDAVVTSQTVKPKPTRAAAPSLANMQKRPESIAVKRIIFTVPQQLPGKNPADHIKCEDVANRDHYTCTFIPALRHHEITFHPADQRRPAEVCYVHETCVATWFAA